MDAAFYTAVRVDAALFTAVGVFAAFDTASRVDAAPFSAVGEGVMLSLFLQLV